MRKTNLSLFVTMFTICFLAFLNIHCQQVEKTPTLCEEVAAFPAAPSRVDCTSNSLPDSLSELTQILLGQDNNNFENVTWELLQAYQIAMESLPDSDYYLPKAKLLRAISSLLYEQADIEASLVALHQEEQLLTQYAKNKCDSLEQILVYNYLGYTYTEQANYEQGIQYYSKAVNYRKDLKRGKDMALELANLSMPYRQKGDLMKSDSCAQLAVCIWENVGYEAKEYFAYLQANNNLATVRYSLGIKHKLLQENARSVAYFKHSLTRLLMVFEELTVDTILPQTYRNDYLIKTATNIGANYITQNKEALLLEQQFVLDTIATIIEAADSSWLKNAYKNKFYPILAIREATKGNCETAIAKVTEGINKAIIPSDAPANYPLVFDKVSFLQSLYLKGKVYEICYEQSQEVAQLEMALTAYLKAIEFLENFRNSFASNTSRENQMSLFYTFYNHTSYTAKRLYELTQNKAFLNLAFQISEKGKSITLKEELYHKLLATELREGGPRKPLIEQEKRYQATLFELDKVLHSKNPELINLYRDTIIQTNKAYQNFIDGLKTGSEIEQGYYHLRRGSVTPDLATIQKKWLDNETAVIAYELGDEHSFAFIITNTEVKTVPIKVDSLCFQRIDEFKVSIRDTFAFFQQHSYDLYQRIFAPIAMHLSSTQIKKLVIVPDGKMNEVVFQALLSKPSDPTIAYKDLPYLLNDYSISYLPSLAIYELLNQLDLKDEPTTSFAGFIANPSTLKKPIESLGDAIDLSDQVTHKIQETFFENGKIYKAATKQDFLAHARDSRYIQLTLHGVFDKNTNRYTINFLPTAIDNGQLTIEEVYALRLKATLVFLANCESSRGVLDESEGIRNAASAFLYAGCKGTIGTAKKVADKRVAVLMGLFYHELITNNLSASEALTATQRAYINKTDAKDKFKAHPSSWASYQYTGVDAFSRPIIFSNLPED